MVLFDINANINGILEHKSEDQTSKNEFQSGIWNWLNLVCGQKEKKGGADTNGSFNVTKCFQWSTIPL